MVYHWNDNAPTLVEPHFMAGFKTNATTSLKTFSTVKRCFKWMKAGWSISSNSVLKNQKVKLRLLHLILIIWHKILIGFMNHIRQVGLWTQWNWFNRQRKWGGEGRTSPKGETDETKKKGMWTGLRKEKREEGKKETESGEEGRKIWINL